MSRSRLSNRRSERSAALIVAAILVGVGLAPTVSLADEDGVSFWIPGAYGSLAAVPGTPGWAYSTFYYHDSVSAGSDVAAAREITIGRFSPTVNLSLNASLSGTADIAWLNPSYTFATPVFGGQATIGMGGVVGNTSAAVTGTVIATIPPFNIVRSNTISDSVTGFGDLYPQVSLKWNKGVNNYMVYGTGDIPVGDYSPSSLANLGIGHGAMDGGAGYTFFDEKTGHEFSVVAGLTYNFINQSTNYQSGVDFHVDWGTSQFLTKQLQIGAVGYIYDQITPDSGSGDRVGAFESQVVGVGPQIGYLFPIEKLQGYVNLKGYGEFDGHARASGYNVWLSFAISPAAETPPAATTPMYHK